MRKNGECRIVYSSQLDTVYIECYNRMLFVEIIEGDVEEAKQILTDRYEDWVDGGPCEVCDVCCEEYMLEGLNNEKFIFSVGYGEEIQ